MSDVIWKYPLNQQKDNLIICKKVLHAGLDPEQTIVAWVLTSDVFTEDDPAKKMFVSIYGTGEPVGDTAGEYINTFSAGDYVFHVYAKDGEDGESPDEDTSVPD